MVSASVGSFQVMYYFTHHVQNNNFYYHRAPRSRPHHPQLTIMHLMACSQMKFLTGEEMTLGLCRAQTHLWIIKRLNTTPLCLVPCFVAKLCTIYLANCTCTIDCRMRTLDLRSAHSMFCIYECLSRLIWTLTTYFIQHWFAFV